MTAPEAPTTVTPSDGRARPGVGAAVKNVRDHAAALVGLELELASLELKRKLAALGVGIALLLAAAVLGLYALGFALATIAAALATFLSTWLALLIVTAFLLLVAGLLAAVGLGRVRKGTPPVPEQALDEARKTSEALKSDG
jgi:O-antigen ligase